METWQQTDIPLILPFPQQQEPQSPFPYHQFPFAVGTKKATGCFTLLMWAQLVEVATAVHWHCHQSLTAIVGWQRWDLGCANFHLCYLTRDDGLKCNFQRLCDKSFNVRLFKMKTSEQGRVAFRKGNCNFQQPCWLGDTGNCSPQKKQFQGQINLVTSWNPWR